MVYQETVRVRGLRARWAVGCRTYKRIRALSALAGGHGSPERGTILPIMMQWACMWHKHRLLQMPFLPRVARTGWTEFVVHAEP